MREDAPAIGGATRVLLWTTLFLAIVVALGWVIADAFALTFWRPSTRPDALSLYAYQNRFEPADVLFLGSSRTQHGIRPIVVEAALADRGVPGVLVHNLAQKGASIVAQDCILRQMTSRDHPPALIVLEVGVGGLNSRSRAAARTVEDYATPADIVRLRSAMRSAPGLVRGVRGLFRGVGATLEHFVAGPAVSRHRKTLEEFTRRKGALAPGPRKEGDSLATIPPEVLREFEDQMVRIFRRSRLRRYRIEGIADEALRRAVAHARALGSEIVLLQVPTSRRFETVFRGEEPAIYRAYLDTLSKELKVPVVRPGRDELGLGPSMFRDLNHLNDRGARILSRHVAERVVRPRLPR
jgi:hypothetical protein